jgi:aryl carrier-like protein
MNQMIELAEIWQRVLGVGVVGPDDDFFASGGDSLLALQVVSEAAEQGISVSLTDLYLRPTIRQLLAEGEPDGNSSIADAEADSQVDPADRALLPPGVEAAYPATKLQLGLIYESEVVDRSLYHDVNTRWINGVFDEDLLREAIGLVAGRHEALRTSIDQYSYSLPLQVVHGDSVVPLEVLPGATVDAALARASEPFTLERAPLMRIVVSGLNGTGFQLTVATHHAIMDGWSESRFAWELLTSYDALLAGRRPYLGPPPARVFEFVRLEREALESPEAAAFWRQFVSPPSGASGSNSLVSKQRSRQPLRISAPVPLELTAEALERASRRHQASAKTLLTAAHLRTLAQMRDTDHPITGLAVNGRPEAPGADVMIGLFLNVVPFGVPVDRSDADLVAAVQRLEIELLPYRRYPSAEIVRWAGGPLFDTIFNYVRFHLYGKMQHLTAITAEAPDYRDKTSVPLVFDIINDPSTSQIDLVLSSAPEIYGAAVLETYGDAFRESIRRLL